MNAINPAEAGIFFNSLRGQLEALDNEAAGIPAKLTAAQAAGDAVEIRRLKGRQAELINQRLDLATDLRRQLVEYYEKHKPEWTAVLDERAAAVGQATADLAKLREEFERREAELQAALADHESRQRACTSDYNAIMVPYTALLNEIIAAVQSSAAAI